MNENVETTQNQDIEATITDESERVPVLQQLGILALVLLLIFGTGYIPKALSSLNKESKDPTEERENMTVTTPVPEVATEDAFAGVSVHGSAAYVYDVQSGEVLYEKNANDQLPLASVTKLMTALVAHELLSETTEIPITVESVLQDGNSGLADGESFALTDILNLTLLSSSNDGAYAIAAAVGAIIDDAGDAATFVEAMNVRANDLGLTNTYFRNPTGLDISHTEAGAYGSARDVATLLKHILKNYPSVLEMTQKESARIQNEAGGVHNAGNTNPTVNRIPGIIGSKTGYTTLAGGNLAIAFDAAYNRPVIVVVLGSTYSGRFNDVLTLSEAARNAVQ